MSQKLTIAHIAADREFAHANIYKSKSNGGYEWDLPQLHFFYTERGYFIYRTSIERFVIIRVIDNIVKIVSKIDLVKEVMDFLLNIERCAPHIDQFARKKMKEAIADDFLIQLPEKQVEFRKDRKDAIQLYYQNCIVKITAEKVTIHKYTDLNGFIWESQIIPRQFQLTEILPTGNFASFISNISNGEESRVNSLCSAFGFYLHNFKNASYCPAVILNDEGDSTDGGGTGKSLFFEAIGYFVKMVTEDGEMFDFTKAFAYQRITPDTRLLFFDDAKKGFPLKKLKSFLTGGITTEKKGKDSTFTPFSDSPKVAISSNYGVDNSDNPLARRTHELEISKYYNKTRKPAFEFGRMMFIEWPEADEQWVQFDNYGVLCCQIYLKHGLIEQQLINLPEKKLAVKTDPEFIEFMEDFKFEYEVGKNTMLEQFKIAHPKFKHKEWLTVNKFTTWVEAYCVFHKIDFDATKKDKTGNIRVYRFDGFPTITPDF